MPRFTPLRSRQPALACALLAFAAVVVSASRLPQDPASLPLTVEIYSATLLAAPALTRLLSTTSAPLRRHRPLARLYRTRSPPTDPAIIDPRSGTAPRVARKSGGTMIGLFVMQPNPLLHLSVWITVLASHVSSVIATEADAVSNTTHLPATWAELRSPYPALYRARLEAAGFPAEIVVAVLRAERRLSDPLRDEPVRRATYRLPAFFWETSKPWDDIYLQAPSSPPTWNEQAKTAAEAITAPIHQTWRSFERAEIMLPAEERARWREVETENRERLRAEFGPERAEEYALWCSIQAFRMRHELAYFHPTEEEFRTIHRIQREFFDRYESPFAVRFSDLPSGQTDFGRTRSQLERAQNQQLAAALGPERYRRYQRVTHASFALLAQLGTRFRLDDQLFHDIWLLRDVAQTQSHLIAEDYATPLETRRKQLADLADVLVECAREMAGPEAGPAVAEQVSPWFDFLRQGMAIQFDGSGGGIGGQRLTAEPVIRNRSTR